MSTICPRCVSKMVVAARCKSHTLLKLGSKGQKPGFLTYFFLFSVSRKLSDFASSMKAVVVEEYGGPEKLLTKDFPKPVPAEDQVLIHVFATAVNRLDCLQRKGMYPVPKGESEIFGVEASGIVEQVGDKVSNIKVGDKVMALLGGGGYAEYVSVHHGQAMKIPQGLDFVSAAAIPEVFLTAYQLMHFVGHVQQNERILIHAGGSGVGTALTQLGKLINAESFVTAGSSEKLDAAKDLGATHVVNYKEEDFSEVVLKETNGKGVGLILDPVGASYWEKNIKSLAIDGRWVLYGLLGGGKINGTLLVKLLQKRGQLLTSTLRSRSLDYKCELVRAFTRDILPKFETGDLKPIVDSTFPLADVASAHKYMEESKNIGKIVIKVRENQMHDEL